MYTHEYHRPHLLPLPNGPHPVRLHRFFHPYRLPRACIPEHLHYRIFYNGFLDSDGDGVRTGGDLRFYASSGKELAYEIADWNTSGTSNIWVKAPAISSSANTVITAVWGKTGDRDHPGLCNRGPGLGK